MIVAISTGLFFALRNILNKYIISNRMNPISWFYLYTAISVILFPIIIWSFTPIEFPSMNLWIYIMVSSITGFVGGLIFIYALTLGDVTTAMPILSSRPIFVLPMSFIFLNEFYGFGVAGWIMVIVLGAMLTSWKEGMKVKDLAKNKALGLFLFTTFLWSIMDMATKPALQQIDSFNFTSWWNLIQAPFLLIFIPFVFKEKEIKDLKKKWKPIFPYVLLEAMIFFASLITLFYAFKFSVSLSEALVATQGLFTVAIGFLITRINPKIIAEKHSKRIYLLRLAGSILILIGIYQILV